MYAARDEGRLIGYIVFVLAHLPHYKTVLCADMDLFYLAPDHRQGMAGYRLLKHARAALIEEGVQRIRYRTKAHASYAPLLERLGATPTELLYEEAC